MSFNSVKMLEGKKKRKKRKAKIKETISCVSTFNAAPESSLNTVAEILTPMAARKCVHGLTESKNGLGWKGP